MSDGLDQGTIKSNHTGNLHTSGVRGVSDGLDQRTKKNNHTGKLHRVHTNERTGHERSTATWFNTHSTNGTWRRGHALKTQCCVLHPLQAIHPPSAGARVHRLRCENLNQSTARPESKSSEIKCSVCLVKQVPSAPFHTNHHVEISIAAHASTVPPWWLLSIPQPRCRNWIRG